MKNDTAKMQKELDGVKQTMSQLRTDTDRSSPNAALPHALRKHAIIGNLGWDDDETTVEARAKELLTAAGVMDTDYVNLDATRTKGSMAELWFHDPEVLCKTRLTIKSLKKTFPAAKAPAWLDVKNTPEQNKERNKPKKIVHRIAEFLSDAEKQNSRPGDITKDLTEKTVKRNLVVIGSIAFGKWRWKPQGCELYSETTRTQSVEWVERD